MVCFIMPNIQSIQHLSFQRVTDILSGQSEQEAVLFDSPDCVILPDMKWDRHTVESLYLVAIARDPSIRSLRDLRQGKLFTACVSCVD